MGELWSQKKMMTTLRREMTQQRIEWNRKYPETKESVVHNKEKREKRRRRQKKEKEPLDHMVKRIKHEMLQKRLTKQRRYNMRTQRLRNQVGRLHKHKGGR